MTPTPRTEPFISHSRRYDEWFEQHEQAYLSELLAVRAWLPIYGRGLEIGIGTGRFAAPLGIRFGIDPVREMLTLARARGADVAQAVAEALPFSDAVFDYALIVTTICFVDDARAMLREAHRVLRPEGLLVIGFIDRQSIIGREYAAHRTESVFYRNARFYSGVEVEQLLTDWGFGGMAWAQTLFTPLRDIVQIEPMEPGKGRGAFLVVRATRRDP